MPQSSSAPHASRTSRGNRRWLRTFLPAVLVLVWLGLAAVGGPLFGISLTSREDADAATLADAEAPQAGGCGCGGCGCGS